MVQIFNENTLWEGQYIKKVKKKNILKTLNSLFILKIINEHYKYTHKLMFVKHVLQLIISIILIYIKLHFHRES